jgi:hypothetical protein
MINLTNKIAVTAVVENRKFSHKCYENLTLGLDLHLQQLLGYFR